MGLNSFEELAERVKRMPKRTVVLAAAHDPHALEAVLEARSAGLADCVLVGDRKRITECCRALGREADGLTVVDSADDADAAAKAVSLIREGRGDLLMKGGLETAVLMRAVLHRETGLRTGGTISHMALVRLPAYRKLLAVTDSAIIPHPTLEQKELILQNALALYRALGCERPKVALLTASETPNERQPETLEAATLAERAGEGRYGPCEAAGPISLDLAVSAESAAIKKYSHPVAGDADILLTPDIVSGNLLTKSLLYFGGGQMAGCVVGARVPIVMTSRGATAEEKRLSILLCAAASGG